MAQVQYTPQDQHTSRITVSITKDELDKELVDILKKERGRVNMKGFRKGKTPLSTLRKMVGNQHLSQIIDTKVNESLTQYLEENDISILFSPRPDANDDLSDVTATRLRDIELNYDLVLEPTLDINIPEKEYTSYVPDLSEELITEQVELAQRRIGEQEELEEGEVQESDLVLVSLTEAGPIENPHTNETRFLVKEMSEELIKQLVGKPVGTTISVDDLSKLDTKNNGEAYIKQYLLEVGEEYDLEGKTFDLEVKGITRVTPAELNEDFFSKYDPTGEIDSEEKLRQSFKDNIAKEYTTQSNRMIEADLQLDIIDSTDIQLSEELLQRLFEEISEDKSYERFKRSIAWMLISTQYARTKDIKIEFEDIRSKVVNNLMQMFGNQMPEFVDDGFIDNYVQRILEDREQVNQISNEVMADKVMTEMRKEVTLKEVAVDPDTLNDHIKEFSDRHKAISAQEEE